MSTTIMANRAFYDSRLRIDELRSPPGLNLLKTCTRLLWHSAQTKLKPTGTNWKQKKSAPLT